MVLRPRTKAKIARRTRRCSKCGVIVGIRTRCKRCHKVQ